MDWQHWHGFFQHDSHWADGPVGVTQCPIAPGHSFLYEFSSADQAGTFWYHSHHGTSFISAFILFTYGISPGTQYCDGLRGAMVVYDTLDPHRSAYDQFSMLVILLKMLISCQI